MRESLPDWQVETFPHSAASRAHPGVEPGLLRELKSLKQVTIRRTESCKTILYG